MRQAMNQDYYNNPDFPKQQTLILIEYQTRSLVDAKGTRRVKPWKHPYNPISLTELQRKEVLLKQSSIHLQIESIYLKGIRKETDIRENSSTSPFKRKKKKGRWGIHLGPSLNCKETEQMRAK